MPIHRPVIEQIRHAVAVGNLEKGTALPRARALAGELVVDPNTIGDGRHLSETSLRALSGLQPTKES